MRKRPSIPADLKRKILVEAGHRCAIPTCRQSTTEIVHIVPFAKENKHEYKNLIALCPTCHSRYDKGEIDRKSMHMYKKKIAFLNDRYSKFELNMMDFLRTKQRVIVYGELSIKNMLDEGLVQIANVIQWFDYDDSGREPMQFVVVLTDLGNDFLNYWNDVNDKRLTYKD